MLESLTLRNFQRHRRLTVRFDPRVTVLTGPSDAGKSAVLRALRWIMLNRPAGDQCVRWGAAEAEAVLALDGREIARVRGKNRNEYRTDGAVHAAFGAGVPDAAAKLANVDAANFQLQHDGPFLFCLSPGEAARELNRVVALDLIDRTLAALAAGLRRARTEAEVGRERLAAAERAAADLAWTEEADAALAAVEAEYTAVQEKRGQASRIDEALAEARKHAETALNAAEATAGAARWVAAGERAAELREKADGLALIISNIDKAEQEAAEARSGVEAAEAELKRQMKGRCPVCGKNFRENSVSGLALSD